MTKTQKLNGSLIGLTVLLLTLLTLPAKANPQNCGPRGTVVERLSSHFGETRRGIGLARQNRVVEVFASDASGSWTITITLPDGNTCLVASGQAWEDRMDDLSHLADMES
ncbi:hypothetical protein [Jannaschia sp. M317]|uniref:hypothetical protein n=1 Tax=Jannaschia sp. M317 TaxID=2867011 RepID=UPI0021A280FC|nr:hypothetical protein [Jannaschia sp. M317]UWQ18025.1 hypothetical protein K3551_01575 [Jannaschia sp. M317]